MLRRLLLVVATALALTACRLDVAVDIAIGPDGTGTVTVVATADAEVVDAVPGLAESLVFDDAVEAGWRVDGPDPTDDGGLTITLTHDVSGPEELANVLASLGPPFVDMAAGRTTVDDVTTNGIGGTLVLTDGFGTFADSDLTAAVGGVPFQEQLDASGATPLTSMSVTLRASLPGEVVESSGVDVTPPATDDEGADGPPPTVWEWEAPLDGSAREVVLQTVQRPDEPSTWASTVATVALVALIAWGVVSLTFIAWVIVARRRRARRRRRASPAR